MGGGIGMGNTCKPMAVSFQCMTKFTTNKKKKKESACNAGDATLISGLGRSAGEGISYPLQYSGLENSMDCIVHRVAKSWTQLNNFRFHFRSLTYVESYSMSFCDWLVTFSIDCPLDLSMLQHVPEFSSFLRLINIPLLV